MRGNHPSIRKESTKGYTYLGLDTPVTFTDGNGVALSYLGTVGATTGDAGDQYSGLDRFGRVVDQNWSNVSTGAGIDQFQYGYDADSNVTYMQVVTNTSSGTVNTTLAGQSQLFTYDSLNRLTNFSSGTLTISGGTATLSGTASATQSWILDAVGNWQSSTVNGTTTSQTNNAQNQVAASGASTTTSLDTTFGTDGVVFDPTGGGTASAMKVTQVSSMADGSIIVASSETGESGIGPMMLAKYNPNGTADSSFGTDGVVYLNVDDGYDDAVNVNDMAIQPDGQIVVVGEALNTSGGGEMFIARFNGANGSLDTSFGTDGVVTATPLSSDGNNQANTVSLQSDGDIVVAGCGGADIFLTRYSSGGVLDTTFGTSGITIVTDGAALSLSFSSMAVQANGEFVVGASESQEGSSPTQIVVVRFYSDGGLDTGFGSSGIATATTEANCAANAIAVQPNGMIIVGGYELNTDYVSHAIVVQFQSTGALDTSFGTDGFVSGPDGYASAIALGADGKIVVAGTDNISGSQVDIALMRLNPDGSPDTSFGTDGTILLSLGTDTQAYGEAVTIQENGKIVVAGWAQNADLEIGAVIARYDSDTSLSYDADGNLLSDASGQQYVYNAWNQLVEVTTPGGDTITYTYDALGRRITETDADTGITTDLYYSNLDQVIEEQQSGTTMAQYVWSPFYVNQLIERDDTPSDGVLTRRLYVEQDADYDVTSLTNSSGAVVERYSYDPYGNVTVMNPSGGLLGSGMASSAYGETIGFQGGWTDPVTGLEQFDERWLTSNGTWLTEDPTGAYYVNGSNLYQFTLSNPLAFVDPTGLQAQPQPTGPTTGPQLVPDFEPDGPYPMPGSGAAATAEEVASGAFNTVAAGAAFVTVVLTPASTGTLGPGEHSESWYERQMIGAGQNPTPRQQPKQQKPATSQPVSKPQSGQPRGCQDNKDGAANKPPNLTPQGAGRTGALKQALRDNGVPTSQQPDRVLPNLDRRGNVQPGSVYEYDVPKPGGGTRTVRIRDDAAGDNYGPNNPQNRGPHFNDENGGHYDY